jgi:hypothetical protein
MISLRLDTSTREAGASLKVAMVAGDCLLIGAPLHPVYLPLQTARPRCPLAAHVCNHWLPVQSIVSAMCIAST